MDRFLQRLQVIGRHQHGRRMSVPGDPNNLVRLVSFLDQSRKPVLGFTERYCFHTTIQAEILAME